MNTGNYVLGNGMHVQVVDNELLPVGYQLMFKGMRTASIIAGYICSDGGTVLCPTCAALEVLAYAPRPVALWYIAPSELHEYLHTCLDCGCAVTVEPYPANPAR